MIRYFATLGERSPRHAEWLRDFGSATVPIQEPVAHRATTPHHPWGILMYRVDVAALTDEQRERVVLGMAIEFGLSRAEVRADMEGKHGIPILAEDVTVSWRQEP